jgi:glycosyltransferase involved in cell wall biosynthesis
VESAVNQTFRDIEILVIDDGSTDETQDVVRRYGAPVRCVYQENKGVAMARNHGIDESRGRYVAFLDADDVWRPEKLEKELAALKGHGEFQACHTAMQVVDGRWRPFVVTRRDDGVSTLEALLLRGNVVGTPSTVICRRLLFSEVGAFDPGLSQCADWDMWVRLATVTEFVYLDEPLVTYRQHGSNMSRDPALLERDSLRVLEKAFSLPVITSTLRARRSAAFARNYMVLAGTYFYAGHYRDFVRCAMRAVSLDARQLGYLAAFPARAVRRRVHGERPVGQWP